MDFSFLNSALALRLLYALPLLLVPYLLRQQGKRVVVPALFLYQGLPSSARMRLWGRLRLTPLFFLQLLILLLLIAAAAQPFIQHRSGKVALVLDTSASMQARTAGGAGSLFDTAKQQATTTLNEIAVGDTVGLYTTTPFPTPVIPPAVAREQIGQNLDQITVTDAPDASDDVLSAFFNQLFTEHGFQRVFFFTDRPLADASPRAGLTVVPVGEPQPNLGIASFQVYRSPFLPDEVDATVVITGSKLRTAWKVGIEDVDTGKTIVSQSVTTGADRTFAFPRLPPAATYRARLLVEDALTLDNEAYAVLPPLTNVPALLITPSPGVAASLSALPNLKLTTIAPQEYIPAQAAGFAVVLFHLTAPEAFPPTNAAFILPPDGNPLLPLDKAATSPQITQWTPAHPLTAYVNFPLLAPAYAQAFTPVGWGKTVINATVGPVVIAGERDARRYAAIGFDLLPYLGKKNLPTSILTLNLLGWLADQAGQPPSLKTGTSLLLQGESTSVRLPDGATQNPVGGMVSFLKQGVYTIIENGVERRVAVNLTNVEESRLRRPLSLAAFAQSTTPAAQTTDRPLWPWLLVAAFVLLGLEWWFATRADRRVQPA